jgi:hypothetical protein
MSTPTDMHRGIWCMPDLALLYSTTLSRPVKHLQFRINYLFDELIRLCGQHCSLWILFQHFNAWLVN